MLIFRTGYNEHVRCLAQMNDWIVFVLIQLTFYCGATSYIVCALDEVQLERESEIEFIPFPTTPLPIQAGSVTCAFDLSLCGWSNDVNSIQWQIGNGSGLLSGYNEGNFIYAISDDIVQGRRAARLLSPLIQGKPGKTELQFWYRVFGAGVDDLAVLLRKSNDTQILWTSEYRDRHWKNATIKFCFDAKEFQVRRFKKYRTI